MALTNEQQRDVAGLVLSWADDYELFASQCVWLKSKSADDPPFRHDHPHPGQVKLRKPYRRGKSIRAVHKARQVGSTTELASQLVHFALFNPGVSVAVAAQTLAGVRGISGTYSFIVQHLPKRLRTGLFKADITLHRIAWPKLGSEIVFDTANSESFRGVPRQAAHLTEVAYFEDLETTLKAFRSTVHGPLVLESTANGPGTFYAICHNQAYEHVFISWRDDSTCRSDIPLDPPPSADEQEFIDKYSLSPAEYQWYIGELRRSSWTAMKQEHPTEPEDAWILGGHRFFSVYFYPGDVQEDDSTKMLLKPDITHKYVIGVDCASGSPTGDRSTAVVLDVTDPKKIRTAARLACRDSPTHFAKRVFNLSTVFFHPIINVERNAGYGLTVLSALRKLGARLYRSKVYDDIKKMYMPRYGYATTATTRPMLLSALQSAVENDYYVPEDALIEDEFNSFRFNADGKPEAISGKHDDLVIAAALAIVGADQARIPRLEETAPLPPPDASFEEQFRYEMKTGLLVDEDPDEED